MKKMTSSSPGSLSLTAYNFRWRAPWVNIHISHLLDFDWSSLDHVSTSAPIIMSRKKRYFDWPLHILIECRRRVTSGMKERQFIIPFCIGWNWDSKKSSNCPRPWRLLEAELDKNSTSCLQSLCFFYFSWVFVGDFFGGWGRGCISHVT